MNRVLVTGAGGYLGKHVVERLRSMGDEVHATTRGERHEDGYVYWHQVDLHSTAAVARLMADVRPARLIHLAWYAVHGQFWTSIENIEWIGATLSLVRAFVESGGSHVVAVGTCAEYDWRYGHCVEDLTPLQPKSLYGACKHAAHVALEAYCRQVGISLAWARIFNAFGPHEHPTRFVAALINAVIRGKPALCMHGALVRDFSFAGDIARGLVALSEAHASGAFNVASGRAVELSDVARRIGDLVGRPDLVLIEQHATPEPRLLTADMGKIQRLGFEPMSELDEGLRASIDWWKRISGESERDLT